MLHNLLSDPLIAVSAPDGTVSKLSLPEVLAALCDDRIAAFPDLRSHQVQAWHAFLVQSAALAAHRAGFAAAPRDAETWRAALRGLTPDHPDDSPWHLVVPDWSRPAFLQPPAPAGAERDYRATVTTPDQIDLLITAKNHDVKTSRIGAAAPVHWLFALVALQTMEGFLGAGNYGVIRMNGGFSSRSALSVTPDLRPDRHFRRDLAVLLAHRDEWFRRWEGFAEQGGLALVWLEPWDGSTALSVSQLDPWFIEICRRVRLMENDGGLVVRRATSTSARIAAKACCGNIGDPWLPVDADGKALSLTGAGFRYDKLKDLLFDPSWIPAPLQNGWPDIDGDDADLLVVARGLARGQGQTAGWHERVVPIPAELGFVLRLGEARERMGAMARARIELAALMMDKVLRPALFKNNDDPKWVGRWKGVMDAAVDTAFFPALWDEANSADPEAARAEWVRTLWDLSHDTFNQALTAVPRHSARAYRFAAEAEGLLCGLRRKHFPTLFPPSDQEVDP